jgi:hypothetical protein
MFLLTVHLHERAKNNSQIEMGGGEGLESGDDIFAEQNPPNGGFNILLHHSP